MNEGGIEPVACERCGGSGFVDDGEITGSGGVDFENGPVKCVKDCPDCAVSSAERLEPCPWCGEVPNEDSYALRDGGYKYGGVVCGCGAQGPDVRTDYRDWPAWKPEAIAAWNARRAPAEAGVAEVFYDGTSREPTLMWVYDGYKPGPNDVVLYTHPSAPAGAGAPSADSLKGDANAKH